MSQLPCEQVPGVIHRAIGDLVVTAVSDGYIGGAENVLINVEKQLAEEILKDNFRYPPVVEVNAFLVRSRSGAALIDCGAGVLMGRSAGRLPANLAAAGISVDEIDAVLLTHIHPDHCGGLADRDTGEALFPNAELFVNTAEHAHWFDDAEMARADERERAMFFTSARAQLAPYSNRMRFIENGEAFPGIFAEVFPGHTPGHTTYTVSSGDESLFIWGDAVHVPELQVAQPEVGVMFDLDAAEAEISRRKIFEKAFSERLLVAGMHLGFPGFYHLIGGRGSYRLQSAPWAHKL